MGPGNTTQANRTRTYETRPDGTRTTTSGTSTTTLSSSTNKSCCIDLNYLNNDINTINLNINGIDIGNSSKSRKEEPTYEFTLTSEIIVQKHHYQPPKLRIAEMTLILRS